MPGTESSAELTAESVSDLPSEQSLENQPASVPPHKENGTPSADAGSLKELLQVSLPLILSSGTLTIMHVVDRVFLTWDNPDALAAAFPAGLLNWTLMSLAIGTAMYVNTFVAQYEGAGNGRGVAKALWQGFYFALIAAAGLGSLIPLAPYIFQSLGHDPSIRAMESEYFSILCIGAGPYVLATTLSCFYSGRGKTQVIMWVDLSVTVLNAVLAYLLIFGDRAIPWLNFGWIPPMGIRGAALATVTANFAQMFLFVLLIARGQTAKDYGLWIHWKFDRELFGRLLWFGLPNGVHMFLDVIAFSAFVQIIGMSSKAGLAAASLVINLNMLAFVPLIGLGTSVMTLVGKRIGEKRAQLAVQTTWMAFAMAATYTTLCAVLYAGAPDLILSLHGAHADPAEFAALRETTIVLLRYVAVYVFFDAMAIVFSSAIRGAGDTRWVMLYSAFCGWTLMVIPTFLIYHYLGNDLSSAFMALTAFIMALGIGCLLRFQGGRWKKMSVIEHT